MRYSSRQLIDPSIITIKSNDSERIDVERQFNRDSKQGDEDTDINRRMDKQYDPRSNATNSVLKRNKDNFDQGMPMRASYTIKKSAHDQNRYVDFNIFDKDDIDEENEDEYMNVGSYDPASNGSAGYSDVMASMAKISNQVAPVPICATGIDKLCCKIYRYVSNIAPNDNIIINAFGLYMIFAGLYIPSDGSTLIDLKNFFGFPKQDLMYEGSEGIIDDINKTNGIKSHNLMIIGNNVPYDIYYHENIKDYNALFRVDINKPDQEAYKINKYIAKRFVDMKKTVIPDNFNNLQLMFVNLLAIKPMWSYSFDKVDKSTFYSKSQEQILYLYSSGKLFDYYEDNTLQLLEIKCDNDTMSMGIILTKTNDNFIFDDIKIKFYISYLQESALDIVKIPIFKQNLKMRYTNILKKIGLNSPFIKVVAPDLFPEHIVLQDIVQNVHINITESASKNPQKKGYRNTRTFIANRPFLYYFRLIKTNTIIIAGRYK